MSGKSDKILSKFASTTSAIPQAGLRKADRSGKQPAFQRKAVWHLSWHFVRLQKSFFELFHSSLFRKSARELFIPAMCHIRNRVLYLSKVRTKSLTSNIISLFFEVCQLTTSTSTEFSVMKQMHLLAMVGPLICNVMMMEKNFRKVIIKELHDSGDEP